MANYFIMMVTIGLVVGMLIKIVVDKSLGHKVSWNYIALVSCIGLAVYAKVLTYQYDKINKQADKEIASAWSEFKNKKEVNARVFRSKRFSKNS